MTRWMFAAGIVLLLLVLVMGEVGKGAQRWLDIGIVRFQPSEIMKLGVPMMAAWYLHERPLPPTIRETLLVIIIIGLLFTLLFVLGVWGIVTLVMKVAA